ncbi:hypothetical protein KBC99_02160 [Candidatus Saccharibacteria bacterium]|nr:hypothetical protein [Candidatus Saccharibacteria bacterium]
MKNSIPTILSAITNYIELPSILFPPAPTVQAIVDRIFSWLMYAVGVIGIIMMSVNGYLYMLSAGNPGKTKQALMSIIYTCIGFGVAILGRSIIDIFVPVVKDKSDLGAIIGSGMNLFFWVIGITGVIMMIIAGLFFIYSAGDPGKTKQARDTIVYAAVGLGVAIIGGGAITLLNSILK